jgi:hypothetical protein
MICNKQLDAGTIMLDRQGLLVDPAYIARAGRDIAPARQNVATAAKGSTPRGTEGRRSAGPMTAAGTNNGMTVDRIADVTAAWFCGPGRGVEVPSSTGTSDVAGMPRKCVRGRSCALTTRLVLP